MSAPPTDRPAVRPRSGRRPIPPLIFLLVLALAALVVVVGIWPEPLLTLAEGAAAALTGGGPG